MISRRLFLGASAAAFAVELFGVAKGGSSPNPALEKFADTALREARRFNQSPVRLLQNITKLGTPVRVQGGEGSGMIAPPVQASGFTFSSVSDAV